MDVDPFKIIHFEDLKTGKIFSHHFADETEVFLACPNHRSGGHCIRSISVEEMKEDLDVYYVCRAEVLIDRNIEAYEKRTLVRITIDKEIKISLIQVKLTEMDLNNVSKALESGLYSFKTVDEDCSPRSRPYHILTHEDLRIHAELREKYNHYKNAKFLMNMRRAPSGYFYAYEGSRPNDGKLIEIDVCLFSPVFMIKILVFLAYKLQDEPFRSERCPHIEREKISWPRTRNILPPTRQNRRQKILLTLLQKTKLKTKVLSC